MQYLALNNKRESNGRYAAHAHVLLSDSPSEETLEDYRREFGFIDISDIVDDQSLERVAYYLIGNVTNGLESASIGANKKRFSSSRGLKKAELFYEGFLNIMRSRS